MEGPDHRSPGGRRALLLGAGVAAGVLHAAPALAGRWSFMRRPLGIAERARAGGGVALTFDDGPHPQGTPAVLDALARHQARATFFLVGEQVERDPALAREIAAAGHGIGLHCFRHRNMLRLTPAQTREDVLRARVTIEEATEQRIELYRPPYGIFSAAALAFAHANGWRPLLWTHWGRDWAREATPQSIVRLLTEPPLEPGSVLLLHDADDYGSPGSWRRTLGALPLLFEELGRRGLGTLAAP